MVDFSNFKAYEGTLSGEETIVFPWRAYRLLLMNDSGSADVLFRFHEGANTATLLPTEVFAAEGSWKEATLTGTGAYRMWIYG